MFVFTSCTNNYIPKARVLASTLKAFHPDWTVCLLLGEKPPESFRLEDEPFDRLAGFDQLGIPDYRSWLFRHRIVEICTAAKGPALFHFLVREAHDKVMYLDPDIMVCNSLSPLEELLNTSDVLLTPHQLVPQPTEESVVDNELVALRYGVFNLGFAAAALRGDGPVFARWWRDRLLRYCYDDIPNGLFTDQRWCDLVPAFFSNMHIVRDPGCNAASWNLTDRTITRDVDGAFWANDGPLRFYHFTGFDSGAGDTMTGRYAKNMPAVHELWSLYRERLMAAGQANLGRKRWAHAVFADGTPISDAMRLLYRHRVDLQQAFPDPFAVPGFLQWYRADQGASSPLGQRVGNKFLNICRRTKSVLNQHGGFPTGLPGTARQGVAWLKKWGVRGVARRIWNSSPASVSTVESLPALRGLLADPERTETKTLLRLLDPENAPVCVIEHDWGGGAGSYCRERISALRAKGRAVISLCYVERADRVEMTVWHGEESLHCEVAALDDLQDARFPRINRIIVNEFAGWFRRCPLDHANKRVLEAVAALAGVGRAHGAHLEVLFHDYYPVCPTINLLTPEGKYCGLNRNSTFCDTCALRGRRFSMATWRSGWGELLALADEVVFFSENTRDTVRCVYPLRDEQVRLRPHDVDPLGDKLAVPAGGPMRVAVVGLIQRHKGADLVCALGRLLERAAPDALIVVFGELEARNIPRNVMALGPYARNELPDLLRTHRVTVGLFPSVWPETFSYVAHELGELGLPLVSFDLGAQGDYVRTLPNSRVVKDVNAQAALSALLELDAARSAETI